MLKFSLRNYNHVKGIKLRACKLLKISKCLDHWNLIMQYKLRKQCKYTSNRLLSVQPVERSRRSSNTRTLPVESLSSRPLLQFFVLLPAVYEQPSYAHNKQHL